MIDEDADERSRSRTGHGSEADRHARGVTVRRVYPQSPHDIFIAVRHPDGFRMLTHRECRTRRSQTRRCAGIRALPRTRGLEMQLARLADDGGELRVVLTDTQPSRGVQPARRAISPHAAWQAPDAAKAVLAAVGRFEHWRQMLQRLAANRADAEERRGLFGELNILRATTSCRLCPPTQAVGAWTGPTAAHQDFQLPDAAIEVKTSSGQGTADPRDQQRARARRSGTAHLVLAYFSLDERRGGQRREPEHRSSDRTRRLIDRPGRHGSLLDDLLVRAGYLQAAARPVRRTPVHRTQGALLARHWGLPADHRGRPAARRR